MLLQAWTAAAGIVAQAWAAGAATMLPLAFRLMPREACAASTSCQKAGNFMQPQGPLVSGRPADARQRAWDQWVAAANYLVQLSSASSSI